MNNQKSQPIPKQSPNQKQNNNPSSSSISPVLVVVLFVILALVVALYAYILMFDTLSKKQGVQQPAQTQKEAPIKRQEDAAPPLPTLSKDDSVSTIEKELNDTTIDDFSQDLQKINSDIGGL